MEKDEEDEWGFDEVRGAEGVKPISLTLNVVRGVVRVSSIHLVGRAMGKEVSFLVDIGATHNFVDSITVARLNLSSVEIDAFNVTVARDEKIVGERCCPATVLSIQGVNITVDLLVVSG